MRRNRELVACGYHGIECSPISQTFIQRIFAAEHGSPHLLPNPAEPPAIEGELVGSPGKSYD